MSQTRQPSPKSKPKAVKAFAVFDGDSLSDTATDGPELPIYYSEGEAFECCWEDERIVPVLITPIGGEK